MTWTDACRLAELAEQEPARVMVQGVPVCLVRVAAEVFALFDECSHAEVPLSEGTVQAGAIECWRHGSQFDLRTGALLNPPAIQPIVTYPTRVDGGQVQVDI